MEDKKSRPGSAWDEKHADSLPFDPAQPPLKWVRKIVSKKEIASDYCTVEGWKCFAEALQKCRPNCILLAQKARVRYEQQQLGLEGVPTYVVDDKELASCCDTSTPEGILGVFPRPQERELQGLMKKPGLHLVLYHWSDPGNVGSAVRTARGLGLASVLRWGAGPDFFSSRVIRGSMGSVFHMPLCTIPADATLAAPVASCLFATAAGRPVDEFTAETGEAVFLVIGSESHGFPEAVLRGQRQVSLAMRGGLESYSAPIVAALLAQKLIQRSI